MSAAITGGLNQGMTLAQVELRDPRAGEILVKIHASGLCASDLNAIDGKRNLVPFPAILGHEAAGVIQKVGPGESAFAVGDHVILSIVPFCGECSFCEQEIPNYCTTAGNAMGAGGLFDGESLLSAEGERVNHFLCVSSFAEYAVVPSSGAVKLTIACRLTVPH